MEATNTSVRATGGTTGVAADPIELTAAMQNRADVYSLLARLFRLEVDENLLVSLRTDDILNCDGPISPDMTEGVALIRAYLTSSEASTLDLARDYAKVFCGAGSTNKTSAYPFESVYTSADGMMMQEARDAVLEWYHRFGLGKSADWHDCEDHIALELEFLTYLISQYLAFAAIGDTDTADGYLSAQRDFIRAHLLNWVPGFTRDVAQRARTDFYRGLALLTNACLQDDYIALAGVVDDRLGASQSGVRDESAV